MNIGSRAVFDQDRHSQANKLATIDQVGSPRVALVHDWLNGMRGGEKVLEQVCLLFPNADLFTLFYEPQKVSPLIRNMRVIESRWAQKFPAARRHYRKLLLLMPRMVAEFPTPDYDLVIATSHCVAKGVRPPRRGTLLAYVFSPMRYVWDHFEDYLSGDFVQDNALRAVRSRLQRWDVESSRHIDSIVADSAHIARKIEKFWGRKSGVIYPHVDMEAFKESAQCPVPSAQGNSSAQSPAPSAQCQESAQTSVPSAQGESVIESVPIDPSSETSSLKPQASSLSQHYFLVVSALVPYKHVERAVEAAQIAGKRLVVVGEGPERGRLQEMARESGADVEFRGWAGEADLVGAYQGCEALLYPGVEDFGITALEAQACGRPVIALREGGATETVVDGVTGTFFDEPSAEGLAEALTRFRAADYEPARIRAHAEQFSAERFRAEFMAWVEVAAGLRILA